MTLNCEPIEDENTEYLRFMMKKYDKPFESVLYSINYKFHSMCDDEKKEIFFYTLINNFGIRYKPYRPINKLTHGDLESFSSNIISERNACKLFYYGRCEWENVSLIFEE